MTYRREMSREWWAFGVFAAVLQTIGALWYFSQGETVIGAALAFLALSYSGTMANIVRKR